MNNQVLQQKIAEVGPWFHSIDLGDSIVTPGGCPIEDEMERSDIYFEMGIEGLSVLDVGAWDGFYSFEAERRGASRVLAVDHFCWEGGAGTTQAPFLLAREVLGSKVEDRVLDIPETTVEQVGEFDMVLFNGIIYHIPMPVVALYEMAKITKKVMFAETYIDNLENPRPVMVYYGAENNTNGLPTTGWGPNSVLMHGMLKKFGFETVLEFPSPDHPHNRSIFVAFKPGHGFDDYVKKYEAFAQPRFTGTPEAAMKAKIAQGDVYETLARLEAEVQRLSGEVAMVKDMNSWRSLFSAIRKRIQKIDE